MLYFPDMMKAVWRFILDPLGTQALRKRVAVLEASAPCVTLETLAKEFFARLPPYPDANRVGHADIDAMQREAFRLARNWIARREGRNDAVEART